MNNKRLFSWLFVIGLGILTACSAEPTVPPPTATPVPTSVPTATLPPTPEPTATTPPLPFSAVKLNSTAIANNLIDENPERTFYVYLPPSYNASTHRYPVVYFLPGFGNSSMNVALPGDMDSLMTSGTVDEMIIVVVPGVNRLGGSFYVNSPATGNWEDFVVEEVVGYIDSHYRTLAQAESRGISGHSMGGFGALNIAMHHPEMFSAVYSLSPGLFSADGLANSQMFGNANAVKRYTDTLKESEGLPDSEAFGAMLAEDSFTTAYGLAFASDPERQPFYFDYPYHDSNGELVRDEEIWNRWESGFGGIPAEVQEYKDNFLKLKGLIVDYGTADQLAWIPRGCIYYDEQLTAAGIPHELAPHSGNHQNNLPKRILEQMMPFFSRLLVRE